MIFKSLVKKDYNWIKWSLSDGAFQFFNSWETGIAKILADMCYTLRKHKSTQFAL